MMRLFCCAAILRAAADEMNENQIFVESQNESLAPLIESALFLGGSLPAAVAGFITWRLAAISESDDQRPFFAFGLLLLALLSTLDKCPDADADALAAFVERVEMNVLDPTAACTPDMFTGSFLDLVTYDQRHRIWRKLAATVRERYPAAARLAALMQRIEAE